MTNANEELAHRFHMYVFQTGRLEVADEIVSSSFVWHGGFAPAEQPCGPDGVKQVARAVIAAFPDRKIVHHDAISSGDKVLIRWSMSGTQTGELMGIPPTTRRVTITGFDYFRFEGGKIVEMWQEADQLSMLRQLGVMK